MDIRVAQYSPIQNVTRVGTASGSSPASAIQQPASQGGSSGQPAQAPTVDPLANALRTIANNEGRGKLVDIFV